MAKAVSNKHRGSGLQGLTPLPLSDAAAVGALLAQCPAHAQTPLKDLSALAEALGIDTLWAKDERDRMGLGSFKALGAAHKIARDAAAACTDGAWADALVGHTYVTASAGNHGLSVAAGAAVFGANAVVYLAETVPAAFEQRLRDKGADPVRAGATYEDSMAAADKAAQDNGWTLLSDSSWPGYTDAPFRVMEGYLQMAREAAEQVPSAPTHILLQAGVGGMAAAVAAFARERWADAPVIVVAEPEAAPALIRSIEAGRIVDTQGPVSAMGRLDCKTPSMIALAGLSRDADLFMTLTEAEGTAGAATLAAHDMATTPSGGAGVAALLAGVPGIGPQARVLVFVTEGPEGG